MRRVYSTNMYRDLVFISSSNRPHLNSFRIAKMTSPYHYHHTTFKHIHWEIIDYAECLHLAYAMTTAQSCVYAVMWFCVFLWWSRLPEHIFLRLLSMSVYTDVTIYKMMAKALLAYFPHIYTKYPCCIIINELCYFSLNTLQLYMYFLCSYRILYILVHQWRSIYKSNRGTFLYQVFRFF